MTEIIAISRLQKDPNELQKILNRLHGASVTANAAARLYALLATLRDNLIVTIEYNYVDAMYRDEYYRFYATKYRNYERNCAKMSFFEPGCLTPGQAIDYAKADEITKSYLGFVVLRPIDACIGRNVISLHAKKPGLDNVVICRTSVATTAIGLKVTACGFPHSSQDGEMMACAETALWSIAEYYGYKYPGHKPVTPSEILEAMRPFSYQRQLPSRGLTFNQISVGMRTFGFSPEIYSLYKTDPANPGLKIVDNDIKEVMGCYIESGFPLAICLQGGSIGHAVVCVGKTAGYAAISGHIVNGKRLYFSNQSIDQLVFNDDNMPCYQITDLFKPTSYYRNAEWDKVHISSFIVPLPSKVYMDAYIAIKQSKLLLGNYAPDGSVARTYLASCRSLRNHIALSGLMTSDNKNLLLNINLPRFVWITEFSSIAEYDQHTVSGIIILDATEPAERSTNALILALCGRIGTGYNYDSASYENLLLPAPFLMECYNKNIY